MGTQRDAFMHGAFTRVALLRAARLTSAFAVVLGTISISSARADESSGNGNSEQARAETAQSSHRAAVVAYARGQYREAIDLFLEANRLRPSAALSFNVARCYEQLHDVPSTLAWYRDYLRRSDGPSDASTVERLVARLERRLAQKGVQQVSVLSTPDGATVVIDGNPVGVSPWTGALAPGVHSVDLTLTGYEHASEQFELTPEHARDVELTLVTAVEPQPRELPLPAAAITQLTREQQRPATAERQRLTRASDTHDRPSVLSILGWTSVGVGGAALAGGLVFEILRRDAEKDAQGEPMQIRFAQAVETMHSRQTAARVLVGTGAGVAVAGSVLLLVAAGQVERAPLPQLALSCTSAKCSASVAGRF